jgi:hypothetical protein
MTQSRIGKAGADEQETADQQDGSDQHLLLPQLKQRKYSRGRRCSAREPEA